jgi:hypothetical protein
MIYISDIDACLLAHSHMPEKANAFLVLLPMNIIYLVLAIIYKQYAYIVIINICISLIIYVHYQIIYSRQVQNCREPSVPHPAPRPAGSRGVAL